MREIKFKFYDKRTNEVFEDIHMYSMSGDGKVLFADGHDVTESIIPLQYTGLKDKNGTEIYEGDIINGDMVPQVAWCGTDTAFSVDSSRFNTMTVGECVRRYETEVLGNIYENPNLLD